MTLNAGHTFSNDRRAIASARMPVLPDWSPTRVIGGLVLANVAGVRQKRRPDSEIGYTPGCHLDLGELFSHRPRQVNRSRKRNVGDVAHQPIRRPFRTKGEFAFQMPCWFQQVHGPEKMFCDCLYQDTCAPKWRGS